ncbi:MAG: hypothetical protein R3C30_03925 [Hyphomonadaceae bacterium]
MDRHVAERLIEDIKVLAEGFNRLSQTSMSIGDEDERRAFRKALGECMADVLKKLERPVVVQFPDLET